MSTAAASGSAPATPKKDRYVHFIRDVIQKLNADYNLGLDTPDKTLTPRKKAELAALDESYDRGQKLLRRLQIHYFSGTLDPILYSFRSEARAVCRRWVDKPLADRNTLPQATRLPRAANAREQAELQAALLDILDESEPSENTATRRSNRTLTRAQSGPAAFHTHPPYDTSHRQNSVTANKRQSDDGRFGDKSPKKHKAFAAIDDVPVLSRVGSSVARSRPQITPAAVSASRQTTLDSFYSKSASSSKTSLVSATFSVPYEDEPPPGTQSTVDFGAGVAEKEKERDKGKYALPLPRRQAASGSGRLSQDSIPLSSGDIDALTESFDRHEAELSDLRGRSKDLAQALQRDVSMPDILPVTTGHESEYLARLKQTWPTLPPWLDIAPFAVAWEVTRVALHCAVDLADLKMVYNPAWENHRTLWSALREHHPFRNKPFPERPSDEAWSACFKDFRSPDHKIVVLAATLKYESSSSSSSSSSSQSRSPFQVELKPATLDKSYRVARRFGADRFLEVTLPALFQGAATIKDPETARPAILRWLSREPHHLLGRQWRAYFTKGVGQQKTVQNPIRPEPETRLVFLDKVYFFAEHGRDLSNHPPLPVPKGLPLDKAFVYDGTKIPVQDMLDWLLHFAHPKQKKQPYLKLFSRIQLGLSKTTPAVVLDKGQIIEQKDDILSPVGEVMNDGIGRMSRGLARRIRDELGLPDIPPAVQGRIGPAKGMWLLDTNDSNDTVWLETYPSQRKWECDASDDEQRTLEIRDHATELRPAGLNLQFIPILEDRALERAKVRTDLASCLKTDLLEEIESLRKSMQSPLLFRQWIYENSGRRDHQSHLSYIPFLGAMPNEREEGVAMLVDAGFHPSALKYIQEVAFDMQKQKCNALKRRMKIRVAQSAYIYIVVDFWGLLEEDEVHVCFSSRFSDQFPATLLHGMDVLVARAPAHFPSDIQRVRAVFKPELHSLKDVVVFPRTGNVALASKLSGGDYDGDRAWVCWDPALVSNFENAEVPAPPDLSRYLRKDTTNFSQLDPGDPVGDMIARGIEFNMQRRLLGSCTTYKEKLCYRSNTVRDEASTVLSTLASGLVDQSKQGITFTDESWSKLRRDFRMPSPHQLHEPAYRGDAWDGNVTAAHILDFLKFNVAKPTIDDELTRLNKSIKAAGGGGASSNPDLATSAAAGLGDAREPSGGAQHYDADLLQPYNWIEKMAQSSQSVERILTLLKNAVGEIRPLWQRLLDRGDFPRAVAETYAQWCAIRVEDFPRLRTKIDGKSVALLVEGWIPDSELTPFGRLKASVAFKLWHREAPRLLYLMAGRPLATIKTLAGSTGGGGARADGGGGRGGGAAVMVDADMYAALRPDKRFIRQVVALRTGEGSQYLEDLAEERAHDFDGDEPEITGLFGDDDDF